MGDMQNKRMSFILMFLIINIVVHCIIPFTFAYNDNHISYVNNEFTREDAYLIKIDWAITREFTMSTLILAVLFGIFEIYKDDVYISLKLLR